MIRLRGACRGRTAVQFPANSSHMCCLELALDRQLCTHFGRNRFLRREFLPFINPTALSGCWAHIRAKQLSLLPAQYGCVHALGTGPVEGWYMCATCFKFAPILMQSNQVQSIFHLLLYFMTFLNKFNSARV